MSEATILEGFAEEEHGIQCDECKESRKYYDRLSDGRMLCIECSTKRGYTMDPQGIYHQRSRDLLLSDPELRQMTESLVNWKLDTTSYTEVSVRFPDEVLEQLEKASDKYGLSMEVLINSGVSLILNDFSGE